MGNGELVLRELDFAAIAQFDSGAILRLVGSADAASVRSLSLLVTRLHESLVADEASSIVIDIRALDFMNAACFNVLVAWIGYIQELPPPQRYGLQFVTSPEVPWQRRSLKTLSCFATDLVAVEDQ